MSHDPVNSPSHYAEGREFETIDVIEDWGLGYHLGNAVKYISRAGRKDDILQDLRKAQWYLNREIENLELEEAEVDGTLYELVEEKEDRIIDESWEEAARLLSYRNEDVLDVDDNTLEYWENTDGDVLHLSREELTNWVNPNYLTDPCGWDPSVGPTC